MPITSRKIRVGVCAMDKKARSKAMTAILTRLEKFDEFSVVVFGDDTILNKPVEEWPVVDALLSWFSGGFPLGKAEKYASLHKGIYMVNGLEPAFCLSLKTRQRDDKQYDQQYPPAENHRRQCQVGK